MRTNIIILPPLFLADILKETITWRKEIDPIKRPWNSCFHHFVSMYPLSLSLFLLYFLSCDIEIGVIFTPSPPFWIMVCWSLLAGFVFLHENILFAKKQSFYVTCIFPCLFSLCVTCHVGFGRPSCLVIWYELAGTHHCATRYPATARRATSTTENVPWPFVKVGVCVCVKL